MNIRKLLRTVPMIVAVLATTWSTTQAEFKDLSEASKQKLLTALRAENITVVLPDQKDSDEELYPELESQISIIDNSPSPTGIELVNGEFCASSNNGACTGDPMTCTQTDCPSNCCTQNYGCQSNSCDSGFNFIGGVEAVFYWIDGNGNNGDIRTFDTGRNLIRRYTSSGLDDDGGYAAPRIWIGVQKGHWGIVGRWWDLNVGDTSFNPLNAFGDVDGYGASSEFRSYAGDLELIRTFCTNSVYGQFSFGARHGRLSTASMLQASGLIGNDFVTGSTYEESVFNGTGITFGMQLHKSIGCGVNLFASARGSVLWGDAEATAAATTSIVTPFGNSRGAQYANGGTDSGEMVIGEFQAGVEWIHELKCVPAVAFIRCAFEYQVWDQDSDIDARAINTSFAVPGAQITARSEAGSQEVNLFGLAFSTGITF